VKPANSGSSIGMKIAHTFNELEASIKHALEHSKKVIVEELIRGKEATCGVIENFRGQHLYSLIPTGNLSREQSKQVAEMAREAHKALGLRHYSDSDFMITKSGKIYILETNSSPQFHTESHWTPSLHTVGSEPREFVHHIITLALNK
jgi:D-alanine-D-alanine ligase